MSEPVNSAVVVGPHEVQLEAFPRPAVGEDDAVLDVELAGVCGSDTHNITCGWSEPPFILGHEIVGRVAAVGSRAAARWSVDVGDRVVVESRFGCGLCDSCLGGEYRFCVEGLGYGGNISADVEPHLWGGFSETLYLAPRARVHAISERVPVEAAMGVCAVLANGLRWVGELGRPSIGDTIAVVGPGAQGLAGVVAARESGARHVIVIGTDSDGARFELARAFGATEVIDVSQDDPVERIAAITEGEMADLVLDVTGNAQASATSLKLLRRMGTLVSASLTGGKPAALDLDDLADKEAHIIGANSVTPTAVRAALRLTEEGKYPLEAMVTHRFSLDQVGQAVSATRDRRDAPDLVKAAIVPQ